MPPKNIVVGQGVTQEKAQCAHDLRMNMTEAEKILWQELRTNRLDGWHFRRQQIIHGLIVDFYCHQAGLVIEVDGPVHDQQVEMDRERDRVLEELGFTVIHFKNEQVTEHLSEVLIEIREKLKLG